MFPCSIAAVDLRAVTKLGQNTAIDSSALDTTESRRKRVLLVRRFRSILNLEQEMPYDKESVYRTRRFRNRLSLYLLLCAMIDICILYHTT